MEKFCFLYQRQKFVKKIELFHKYFRLPLKISERNFQFGKGTSRTLRVCQYAESVQINDSTPSAHYFGPPSEKNLKISMLALLALQSA